MENYIQTIYDTESHPPTSYPNELARYLISRYGISNNSRLLDVGCGRGDFLYAFRQNGISAYGVDMFKDEVCEGETIVSGGCNLESDCLPFEDESFDVIFTKSVLEHIHNPENLLKECRRVLRENGRIIAMVPDWQSCMFIYYDDFTHVQPYTVTALRDALRMFGFRDVESELFYQLPVVWKYSCVKLICKILQMFGPVREISKNKFYRFSRELMVLASGMK